MYNNETLLFKYNIDKNGNPISIKVDKEQKQVSINGTIQMEFLPDEFNSLVVLDDNNKEMYEVFNRDEIDTNMYYVDYSCGTIYFDKSQFGKVKIYNYYNKGFQLIGASRIYDEQSINGELIVKTLQDIIDEGRKCLELISTLGNAVIIINKLEQNITIGTILHENLSNDIEIGTPLFENLDDSIGQATELLPQLDDRIKTATQNKKDLDQSINIATETNAILTNTSSTAVQTNLTLEQTMAEAQEDIDKINATGNKSLVVGSSQFINNEYTWTHNMNSENLTVNFIDTTTKEPLMTDYKIIDKNKILVRNSPEHPNIKVILSASYYQGNTVKGLTAEEFAGDSIGDGINIRLKDADGYKYPVTKSDAVFMDDGSKSLKAEVQEINTKLEEANTKLEEAITKSTSNESEIKNARKGKENLESKIDEVDGNIEDIKSKTNTIIIQNFLDSVKNHKSKLIGHRGLNKIYPENTCLAIEKACEMGMFGVEFDIIKTSDGKYCVIHDDTVDRTTNGTGSVERLTSTYIKGLIVDDGNGNPAYYSPLKVPFLEDILSIIQMYDTMAFIELKGNTYDYDKVLQTIYDFKLENKVCLLSFNETHMIEIRKRDKNILLALNGNLTNANVDKLSTWGNTIISTPTNYINQGIVKYSHSKNIPIISYSATSYTVFRQQLKLGVDLMTTDYVFQGGDY